MNVKKLKDGYLKDLAIQEYDKINFTRLLPLPTLEIDGMLTLEKVKGRLLSEALEDPNVEKSKKITLINSFNSSLSKINTYLKKSKNFILASKEPQSNSVIYDRQNSLFLGIEEIRCSHLHIKLQATNDKFRTEIITIYLFRYMG